MALRSSGIPGLDKLLGGGFPKNGCILLHGPAGSGKTIFGLQFLLEGLKKGEKTLYITLDHQPKRFIEQAKSFKWDLEAYMNCGLFSFLDATQENIFQSPEEFKRIWTRFFKYIEQEKINRVVIDPFRFLETEQAFIYSYRETLLALDSIDTCNSLVIIPSSHLEIPVEATWCSASIALKTSEDDIGISRKLSIQKCVNLAFELDHKRYYIDTNQGLYMPTQSKVSAWPIS